MNERVPHPIILPAGNQPQPSSNPPVSFSLQPRAPEHLSAIPEIPPFQKQKRSPHLSDPQTSIPHPPRRQKPNPDSYPNPNPNRDANLNPNPIIKQHPKPQKNPSEHIQKSILPRGQPFQYSALQDPVSHPQHPHSLMQNLNSHSHSQSRNPYPHQQTLTNPHLQNFNPHSHLQTLDNPPFQNLNQHSHLQNLHNPHFQNPLHLGAQLSPSQLHAQRQQLITAYMGAAQPFLLPTGGIPSAPPPQNPQTLAQASPAPKYTQIEGIVAEMRENMIKVLKTSNYKRCKSAKNIRQALREVRSLCKEMRSETTVLGKQKLNARKKATPDGEEGPAKKQKLADGVAKGTQESPGTAGEDGRPANPEDVPKGEAGETVNGGPVVGEPEKQDGGLNQEEGEELGGEIRGASKGLDGDDRTVLGEGVETDGLEDREEETDSDDDAEM